MATREVSVMTDLHALRDQVSQLADRDAGAPYGLARAARLLLEELDIVHNHERGTIRLSDFEPGFSPERLQVGGGSHELEGWFNIDVVPPADLLWDVREGLPFPSNGTQVVFSEHMLEHLDYPRSVRWFLIEACRVLQTGGQIIVGVPDAEPVLRAYASGDTDLLEEYRRRWYANRTGLHQYPCPVDVVALVIRDQEDDPVYHPHFWAYDATNLTRLLTMAGFSDVRPWTFDPQIANAKRQWGTLYLTATK
jgi:SAM-dependent methyltransferase